MSKVPLVESMIRRDRNHANVVRSCVGNEIRDTHGTDHAKEIFTGLVRAYHETDPLATPSMAAKQT